jgi:hypothetical protein
LCIATQDGTLSIWDEKSHFGRATHTVPNAHTPGTDTSYLLFSGDKQTLLSRGGDHTVKCKYEWIRIKYKT